MTDYESILTAAQGLSPTERAQLIVELWDHTSPENWSPPSDAWLSETNRRSDALDAGEMTGSSWQEVRERARRQAGFND